MHTPRSSGTASSQPVSGTKSSRSFRNITLCPPSQCQRNPNASSSCSAAGQGSPQSMLALSPIASRSCGSVITSTSIPNPGIEIHLSANPSTAIFTLLFSASMSVTFLGTFSSSASFAISYYSGTD